MSDEFSILIADRNRHVREFLQRELRGEGYRVRVARDGREVMEMIEGADPPDLLILDLDIPHLGGVAVLEWLAHREPLVPVVVHTFPTEHTTSLSEQGSAVFVEKSGSTDRLKSVIHDMLWKFYPHRLACRNGQAGR